MTRPDFYALDDARTWLMEQRHRKGVKCPCCDQLAKVYKRNLNYVMARCLILIYEYFGDPDHSGKWLHLPTYLNGRGVVARGGDAVKTRYWGLIVSSGEVRDDSSARVGHWRITQKGIDFVERKIAVPAAALIYDEKLLGFTPEQVTIDVALGKRFSYSELMAGIARPRLRQGELAFGEPQ